MAYQTSLLDDLRRFDVPVIEIDGWRTRGRIDITPQVGVNHHTAGPSRGIAPSLNVCINGRSDVVGPLCNVLLGRDRVARLIAAGRSNNAGRGGWKGVTGNSNTLGLEIEHVGTRAETVDPALLDMAARIQAAFAWKRYSPSMVCQHFEWTTRKIDFAESWGPEVYTPDGFRATVAQYLEWGGAKPPKPTQPPKPPEIPVNEILEAIETSKPFAIRASVDGHGMKKGQVWIIAPTSKYHVERDTLNGLYYTRAIRLDKDGQPALADPKNFANIPVLGTV